jgi:hypothetical protein
VEEGEYKGEKIIKLKDAQAAPSGTPQKKK